MDVNFLYFKTNIVTKCKAKQACEREFKKLLKAETIYDVWLVIMSNCAWSLTNKIIDAVPEKFTFPKTFNGFIDFSLCGDL